MQVQMRVASEPRSVAVKSAQQLRRPRHTPCMGAPTSRLQLTHVRAVVYHRISDDEYLTVAICGHSFGVMP